MILFRIRDWFWWYYPAPHLSWQYSVFFCHERCRRGTYLLTIVKHFIKIIRIYAVDQQIACKGGKYDPVDCPGCTCFSRTAAVRQIYWLIPVVKIFRKCIPDIRHLLDPLDIFLVYFIIAYKTCFSFFSGWKPSFAFVINRKVVFDIFYLMAPGTIFKKTAPEGILFSMSTPPWSAYGKLPISTLT